MDDKTYEQFFSALEKIVHESRPFAEKRDSLNTYMGESEAAALEELISWFESSEE